MADSPETNSDGVLTLTIKTDGRALPDTMSIQSIQTSAELNRVPEASVVFLSESLQMEDSGLVDSDTLALGKEIEIQAGYGGGEEAQIFKGVIVSQRLRLDDRSGLRLEVTCRDKAIAMTETRVSALYEKKKDSEVMTSVITDAGLTADVTATTEVAPAHLRTATTDWDFLRLLADRNGHLLAVTAGKVRSAPPGLDAAAKLTVTYGIDIMELDIAVDAQRMIGSAKAASWGEKDQKALVEEDKSLPAMKLGNASSKKLAEVLGTRPTQAATAREFTTGDLKAFNKARLARAGLAAVHGMVRFQGNAGIGAGDMLEISASGDRFSGMGFVSGVEHRLEGGSWTTRAQLGLPQDWKSDGTGLAAAGAEGLSTPVQGLQIGKVLKVSDDPEGKQRIQISLPMLGDPAVQVWARFATPYGSGDAGFQFLPEVDDEVVVAFLSADPNAPVIVGSLHNDKARRPLDAEEENNLKTILTRSQLKIEFDDDKKIITLQTPGGHKVVLDDDATSITMEDSNQNKIVMDASGIAMTSRKDISLKADGKIKVAAGMDASVSGMNVTCEGQTGFTGKGGASAELSAGGQTKVEGSIVMIN